MENDKTTVNPAENNTTTPQAEEKPELTEQEKTEILADAVVEEIVQEAKKDKDFTDGKPKKKHKILLLASTIFSVVSMFIFLFVPYTSKINPLDIFKITSTSSFTTELIVAAVVFVMLSLTVIINIYKLIDAGLHFGEDQYADIITKIPTLNMVISAIYGLGGIAFLILDVMSAHEGITSFAFVLPIINVFVLIYNSVVKSYYLHPTTLFIEKDELADDFGTVKALKRPFPSFELLFYVFLFVASPLAVLFMNLFVVKYDGEIMEGPIRGIDFLIKMNQFSTTTYKIVSLLIYLCLFVDAFFLVCTLISFFSKRASFYKFAATSIIMNFSFVCLISLYGFYYKIIQVASNTAILKLLENFFPGISYTLPVDKITVETYAYFIAIGLTALFLIVLARNPSKHAYEYEILESEALMDRRLNAPEVNKETIADIIKRVDPFTAKGGVGGGVGEDGEEKPLDVNLVENEEDLDVDPDEKLLPFDACPAFTELDAKNDMYRDEYAKRCQSPFSPLTLPHLVDFIVEYARNSRIHLSYTKNDIAAFIAGLGATRLTILQGMSGTGKTSLPKIFMEALYGNCELIEIESSWREKNELLGFYNEFSKMYTPKKFTQCLYKAALNPETITLIVLDEMNLSRIEYYFSDFLSLMENEENQRQIKLSNIKLYNIHHNERHSYSKLVEDHTLMIPTNVWFIGTANRDESTFSISDKVYDRAHTMNFNKRAPAVVKFDKPMSPQFLQYKDFRGMLDNAKKTYKFDIEKNVVIQEVEKILTPFNISFGNRIYNQIVNFVKVYCSCFDNGAQKEFEAVETILLTKVVMKLENKNIDNREALINAFKNLNLNKCAEFISKLSEDF